jgi:DNA-binding CsgD family transcriptional regulator
MSNTTALTKSESAVASLAAQGLRSKEIASRLFVTEKTVKFHLTNIYKKLGVDRFTLIKNSASGVTTLPTSDATALLMEVVTLGRNGKPYADKLGELKLALQNNPAIKAVIVQAIGN